MGGERHPHAELTSRILRAGFRVSNTLGCGFLEKIYENSLVIELKREGLKVAQQVPVALLLNFGRPKLKYKRLALTAGVEEPADDPADGQ